MMKRYFENFEAIDDLHREFEIAPDLITDNEVLFAYYGYGSYCGAAMVLFQRGGKLYEVTSSHCSCYGLGRTWAPDEVTWAQLAMRDGKYAYFESDERDEAKAALDALIRQHVPRA